MEKARIGYDQEEAYFNRINRELIEKKKIEEAKKIALEKPVSIEKSVKSKI